jgi:spore maturation protein CgeB
MDTPSTLACMKEGTCGYLSAPLIGRYDLYLASSAGAAIDILRGGYGARTVKTLYACFDQEQFYPQSVKPSWHLGVRGCVQGSQLPSLAEFLIEPAKRFVDVAFSASDLGTGASEVAWPPNVDLFEHVPRSEHRRFYNSHRFMLSLAPVGAAESGFSPSSSLFEAAACAVPLICEYAEGLESFLEPKSEVLVARSHEDVVRYLRTMSDSERFELGDRARDRVLKEHTAAQRALELEEVLGAVLDGTPKAYLL